MEYPAAHSMDTMWFAVDADGHVAAFESGEGGGVPDLAYVGDDYLELSELIRELPETGAKLDVDGHVASAFGDKHLQPHRRKPGSEIVAFVANLAAVQDLIARLGATASPATTGHVLRFAYGDAEAFDELHARGACTSCDEDFDDPADELSAHGVFLYACRDGIAVPYLRLAIPATPLAIGDAPASVRAHAIRFAGTFADTPTLQPAEHWKSSGWSAGWLATDGKTMRPFPGRERDLDKELGDHDLGSDYVVVNEVLARPDGELAEPDAPHTAPPSARVVASDATPKNKPWWRFW